MVAVTQAEEVVSALSRYLDARDAFKQEKRPSLGFVRADEHARATETLTRALAGFQGPP